MERCNLIAVKSMENTPIKKRINTKEQEGIKPRY
jgi:hypothetical protein